MFPRISDITYHKLSDKGDVYANKGMIAIAYS